MRKDGSSLKSHVEGASLSASACTGQVSQQECVYDDTSHTSLLPISSLLYLAHTLMPAVYHSSTVEGIKVCVMTTYIIAS